LIVNALDIDDAPVVDSQVGDPAGRSCAIDDKPTPDQQAGFVGGDCRAFRGHGSITADDTAFVKFKRARYSSGMPIDISLRHMRTFLAVAEHGSFTRAAHALRRSQSTVTETLRELEDALHVQLLARTTRSVSLTSEGEAFAEMSARVLRDVDGLIADMRALGNLERGRVRVVAAPSLATLVLARPFAVFARGFPGIRLSLADVTSREAERQLLDGQADIAFTSRWSTRSDLAFRPLLRDRFGVVCPPSHRLATGDGPIDWKELADERCVGLVDATGIRAILREAPDLPVSVTNPFYEAATTTSLEMMVTQGLGVAVLPALAARRPPLDSLTFRPLIGPVSHREIGCIWRSDRKLRPAESRLTAAIGDEIKALAATTDTDLVSLT
jgi:DNA-binding transcriptional LysR family regulator